MNGIISPIMAPITAKMLAITTASFGNEDTIALIVITLEIAPTMAATITMKNGVFRFVSLAESSPKNWFGFVKTFVMLITSRLSVLIEYGLLFLIYLSTGPILAL